MTNVGFPPLNLPGVKPEDEWEFYGVSYFDYFQTKFRNVEDGVCGFCTIDRKVNKVMDDISNASWNVWVNELGKTEGHQYRFLLAAKRHVTRFAELSPEESADLVPVVRALDDRYQIDGGYLLVRSGNALKNAKSMPHLHFNYQIPTGLEEVKITVSKNPSDFPKKAAIIGVFEKLRQMVITHGITVDEAFEKLELADQELVKGKLHNPVKLAS